LSSFWRWLEQRGHVKNNIWQGQSVPKRKVPKQEAKRPYTDEEIAKLMAGPAPIFLRDAMVTAALSGMRIDEIAKAKVRDIVDGCIEVHEAKSGAGERSVPIHPDAKEIIDRRCAGKASEDFLFPELPTPKEGSAIERSQKLVKAFVRYRRKLSIEDIPEGARQSRADFHSFRRWFIRRAGDALLNGATGFLPWTIADVVGHSKEDVPLGMTMGRYPGHSSLEAERACVEAVRPPAAP
jgi:integrase